MTPGGISAGSSKGKTKKKSNGAGAGRTNGKKKDGARKGAAAKPPAASKGAPKAGPRAILARLSAEQPALTEAQRAAFRAQYPDSVCESWGARTRSERVFREAVSWAPVVDGALRRHPEALRRYSRSRFAWLLECVDDLAEAREAQLSTKGRADDAHAQMGRARKKALAIRTELLRTLGELAEGNEEEEAKLANATGRPDTAEGLSSSLGALIVYAESWLQSTGEKDRALFESVGLAYADVDAAREAALAVEAAHGLRIEETRRAPRDVPAVNIVEGRVLLEMRRAMRAFAWAREKTPAVPRLVPGPALRGVFGTAQRSAVEPADAPLVESPAAPGGDAAAPNGG